MPGLLDMAADYGRGVVDRTKEMFTDPRGLLYKIFPSPEEGQARYNRLRGLLQGPETPEEQAYKRKLQDLAISQLTVYHGTPNKWAPEPGFPEGRPRLDKIGTGEGVQAYGYGMYFAENPQVAQSYQKMAPDALVPPRRAFLGQELTPGSPEYHAARLVQDGGKSLAAARKEVAGWIQQGTPDANMLDGWKRTLDVLNRASSKADFKILKHEGTLYRTDLPDEVIPGLLNWDAPLAQQSPQVKAALAKSNARYGPLRERALIADPNSPMTGQDLYRDLTTALNPSYVARGSTVQGNAALAAPEHLRSLGIPGLLYADGLSRGTGQGTRNFVIWDQDLLNRMVPEPPR